MERNKWEEEFKDKLNQRQIEPTPHAWERLDAMLNAAEVKPEYAADDNEAQRGPKVIRMIRWAMIAASIAAFLLIATTIYSRVTQKADDQYVHEAPNQAPSYDLENGLRDLIKEHRETQVAEQEVEGSEPQTQEQNRVEPIGNERIAQKPQRLVPHQNPVARQLNKPQPQFDAPVNDQKVNSPQVVQEQQLASVEPKMQSPKNVKVDARSLLSQVDGELELTFREKAIKTINKKYQNVKVALANRNNQE